MYRFSFNIHYQGVMNIRGVFIYLIDVYVESENWKDFNSRLILIITC